MPPFRLVARAAALAAWIGLPAAALGQSGAPAPAPVIAGGSSCPAEPAVWTALGSVVARDRFDARLRALTVTSTPIEIADLGGSFRVIAAGRTRTYRDEARDCDERARVAALFIALAIDPDDALASAPPVVAPPPPPVAQPPAAQPAPGPPPLLRIEVGPALELGLLGGDGQLAWGGGVRLAVGRGKLAAVIGGDVTAPATPTIGGVRLRQWREPLFAGLRRRGGGPRVEIAGELGGTAALISERGVDLTTATTSTSVELGVYGAVGLRFTSGSRLSPFVLARAEVVPGPAEIFDLPHGVVGHAPRLWLGLNAGVSLGFL